MKPIRHIIHACAQIARKLNNSSYIESCPPFIFCPYHHCRRCRVTWSSKVPFGHQFLWPTCLVLPYLIRVDMLIKCSLKASGTQRHSPSFSLNLLAIVSSSSSTLAFFLTLLWIGFVPSRFGSVLLGPRRMNKGIRTSSHFEIDLSDMG